MKLSIDKKDLSTITSLVHRAASNKNTIPVLSGLLIQASSTDGLTMTATDMEIGIKASTKAVDIIEEGTVLVNAYYFADFIKLLPDSSVSMELNPEKAKLTVSYGRSSGSLNTYQNQEYPELPLTKMNQIFSLPQNLLKEALKKTAFAAAGSHFRQVFTGVLFDIKSSELLKIVASDTHRLACFECNIEHGPQEPLSFIIPVRTVNELLRILEDNETLINIALAENNVIFYKDDFLLLSRLIEGQYPNYDQVIPNTFTTKVQVGSYTLAESLERAKTMPVDDKVKIPHVQLSFNDKEAVINSYSEAMGEIREFIENIQLSGENNFNISFNTNYFYDAVKIFAPECEEISISLSGSLGPALLKNPEKNNYVYVLVPLRTNN
jgi:DNA polymerase-3 subunit beta